MFEHPGLIERVTRLEAEIKHEQRMRERELSWLTWRVDANARWADRRLGVLERSAPDQDISDRKALLKLALAVALPLLVLLATGSVPLAGRALGLVMGVP